MQFDPRKLAKILDWHANGTPPPPEKGADWIRRRLQTLDTFAGLATVLRDYADETEAEEKEKKNAEAAK